MERKHKSLLIMNESTDAHVTLNLYPTWDIICWLPHASNVIKPNESFSYSHEKGLKIELIAKFEDRKQLKKKVLLKPQQWVEDKCIRITDSFDLVERGLAAEEKEACLRKLRRNEELDKLDGGCNLYNILRLDMKEVRAMPKEEQDEEIKQAFHREIQFWHRYYNPDHGDDDIAREVIMAYDVLRDREKRAKYNNMADYDSGWLSGKRFKAVFCPECETVEQRLAWTKRMALLGLSVGLTLGGVLAVVLTAGFSTPFLATAIFGGLNALQQTISREAVLNGCDVKKWLMGTGIGYFLAFLPGGAAIGVTALESAALISAAEVIGIRAAIAGGCAVVSSLGSDAKKKFIDGENITVKQAIGHAACQAAIAASTALTGGAVAKALSRGTQSTQTATAKAIAAVESTKSQATATSVSEVAIDKPFSATLLDQAKDLGQKNLVPLTENTTKTAIQGAALAGGAVAKALSRDTQSTQTATAKAIAAVESTKSQATATSVSEVAIDKPFSATLLDQAKDPGQKILVPLTENTTKTAIQGATQLVENQSKAFSGSAKTPSFGENNVDLQDCIPNGVDAVLNSIDTGKPLDGTIRYISKGFWFSRMVVSYILNGKPHKQEKRGNGSRIKIPSNAKEIKVRFQVLRPPWSDISKYNRINGCWCYPYKPHVFRYESPPTRTFIISGPLYWEAVMGVNDEQHNETNEM